MLEAFFIAHACFALYWVFAMHQALKDAKRIEQFIESFKTIKVGL